MRQDARHPGAWGLPGGKVESNETLIQAAERECQEELGFVPDYHSLAPVEKFTSADDAFCYHTFFAAVDHEFRPELNREHTGYAWIDAATTPRPMHPGLWNTLNFDVIQNKISLLRHRVHTSQ
jgi:8-oxo-dGTP pyrophosphatase MutT (NUDIX family)